LQAIGDLYNALRDAIAAPMQVLLELMYHQLAVLGIPSWGLTIIIFTILVKLVFWPLTMQQIRASKAMQKLQPELNELKKLHGKDRERMMQEQMRLYKENQVNPMAGCLPMLIQLPIWIGLYQALFHLQGAGDLTGGFLWIPSLAAPEGFPFLLAILTAASQWVVQRMMQVNTTDPQQKQMNQAMQFMPLMYLFISYRMPAGLVLYWVASNAFSMIQQSFYFGWKGIFPWQTAPSTTAKPRRETVAASPAVLSLRSPGEPTANGNGSSQNGTATPRPDAPASVTPRRTKKRRK
jgi:YidC/Oxa1 family membrane protein insertase